MVTQRDAKAPDAALVLNEFIPFVADWCDPDDAQRLFAEHGDTLGVDPRSDGACPNWQDPKSTTAKINRVTLGWNAAAATFAYGYGKLAELGYKYVGADQLIGGPWPDNEPAVSSMDWTTGEVNAKYWSINLLATTLGYGPKKLYEATYSPGGKAYALPYVLNSGTRGVLVVSKAAGPMVVTLKGAGLTDTTAQVNWCMVGR